jgi:hypothetical protein
MLSRLKPLFSFRVAAIGPGALRARKLCIKRLDLSSFLCILMQTSLSRPACSFPMFAYALFLKASDDGKTLIFAGLTVFLSSFSVQACRDHGCFHIFQALSV